MTRQSIYGYWIAKDEIIEVGYECHAEKAYEILSDLFGVEQTRLIHSDFSIYRYMWILGYVRVINYEDSDYGVEYAHDTKLSRLQKEFIKGAYDADVVAHNGKRIRTDRNR